MRDHMIGIDIWKKNSFVLLKALQGKKFDISLTNVAPYQNELKTEFNYIKYYNSYVVRGFSAYFLPCIINIM